MGEIFIIIQFWHNLINFNKLKMIFSYISLNILLRFTMLIDEPFNSAALATEEIVFQVIKLYGNGGFIS